MADFKAAIFFKKVIILQTGNTKSLYIGDGFARPAPLACVFESHRVSSPEAGLVTDLSESAHRRDSNLVFYISRSLLLEGFIGFTSHSYNLRTHRPSHTPVVVS